MTSTDTTSTPEVELTDKQLVNTQIDRFIEALGMDGQKARYKAQRAIAFQAFLNAISAGSFEELVDEAIANVNELPTGWEIAVSERAPKAEPIRSAPAKVTKAPVKKLVTTPATKAATPAAKTATR